MWEINPAFEKQTRFQILYDNRALTFAATIKVRSSPFFSARSVVHVERVAFHIKLLPY